MICFLLEAYNRSNTLAAIRGHDAAILADSHPAETVMHPAPPAHGRDWVFNRVMPRKHSVNPSSLGLREF